jgi:Flp pilus assembly protein CpaB
LKPWSQLRLGRRPSDELVTELPLGGNGVRPLLRPRASEPSRAPQRTTRGFLQPLPLAGVALVLVAVVGYLAVYSQTTRRTMVLVAARDLPAGTVLRAGDLRSAGLAGDRGVLGAIVPSRQADLALGRRVVISVPAGQPLPRAALAARAAVPSAFTVAVPVLHALGGGLRAGDRVSVLVTFQSAAGGARTRAVARGLEVLAVGQPPTGFDRTTATIPVTLALPDPSVASELALASEAGKIDLLREGNGARGAPIPSAAEGG